MTTTSKFTPANCPLRRGIHLAREARHHPIWSLGFRIFFLAGALIAALQMGVWTLILTGHFYAPFYFPLITWHAHEMIFGFVLAITAGFILTASQNWSGKPGVSGKPLQLLFLLWIIPRFAFMLSQSPSAILSALDLSFTPFLATLLWPYLKGDDLKEERVFYIYFAMYFLGNLLTHLPLFLGSSTGPEWADTAPMGLRLGLGATLCMAVFMGGRVIPFFTESNRSPNQPKTIPWVESLSPWSMWLFTITYVFLPQHGLHVLTSLFAAVIQGRRLLGWQVRRSWKAPLIWVLHLSYFWLVLGLIFSALSVIIEIPLKPFVHSFTIGLVSTLLLGMMTRVSLGHTGRRLIPPKSAVAGYMLIQTAAFVRVIGPLISPLAIKGFYFLSGTLFVFSFGLFILTYAPILSKPRLAQPL